MAKWSCIERSSAEPIRATELPFVQGGVFALSQPAGQSFTVMQMHWFRVQSGQIVEHWAVRDDLSLARQLETGTGTAH